MVTAAMKLKDTWSLEEKLRPTSVQFSSVAQSWPSLCDPMNHGTPGLPVHHQLPEFTQTQVHRVSDAIQPSHPLSSPSPPAPNPSQHQSLFQWVNSSHEVDSILKSRDITLPTKVHLVKAMVCPVVMYGCESWPGRKLSTKELMILKCGVGEDSWESLGLQGDPTSPFWRRSALGFLWKEWC